MTDSKKGRAPKVGESGNWACPKCGNVNFGSRDRCNRCDSGKDGGAGGFAPSYSGGYGGDDWSRSQSSWGQQQQQAPTSPYARELAASYLTQFRGSPDPLSAAITYLSSVDSELRIQSGLPPSRFASQSQQPRPAYGQPAYGQPAYGADLGKRRRTDSAPPREENGNWKCSACSNVNFPFRNECNR